MRTVTLNAIQEQINLQRKEAEKWTQTARENDVAGKTSLAVTAFIRSCEAQATVERMEKGLETERGEYPLKVIMRNKPGKAQ
jgi:hypothetical protein